VPRLGHTGPTRRLPSQEQDFAGPRLSVSSRPIASPQIHHDMNKLKTLTLAMAGAALLASCSIALPVAATSNTIGSKTGTAKATCYLQVLCFDQDASIATAAKNGGITKISTVDITHGSILGIVVTYTTTVTGE